VIQTGAEHHTADTAKAIDANFDAHVNYSFYYQFIRGGPRQWYRVILYPAYPYFPSVFFHIFIEKFHRIFSIGQGKPFQTVACPHFSLCSSALCPWVTASSSDLFPVFSTFSIVEAGKLCYTGNDTNRARSGA
jgi:hypothetical protein